MVIDYLLVTLIVWGVGTSFVFLSEIFGALRTPEYQADAMDIVTIILVSIFWFLVIPWYILSK